jgi:hypothetical protein
MNTKQSSNLTPEPDLQEHRRLINRALTQTAARHLACSAQNADASIWPLVLVVFAAVVLSIAAGVALLVFLQ